MCDIAVDVGVLMTASGKGDRRDLAPTCRDLLQAIVGSHCRLVLDSEHLIENHYRDVVGGGFGMEWVALMVGAGRYVYVKRVRVLAKHWEPLAKRGFHRDNEDFKYYTRTAAASGDKALVTLDQDYIDNRRLLRLGFGLHVFTVVEFASFPLH